MPVLIKPSRLSKEDKKKYPYAKGAIIIIVYSEGHFEGFYDKHCGRVDIRSPEYTVLVVNEVLCPREKDFRRDFEKEIVSQKFEINEGAVLVSLPPQYQARRYSGITDSFLDESASDCNLRIRDCRKLAFKKDYDYLLKTGEISQDDITTINKIKEDLRQTDLIVRFVFFIGHIDIVKFNLD